MEGDQATNVDVEKNDTFHVVRYICQSDLPKIDDSKDRKRTSKSHKCYKSRTDREGCGRLLAYYMFPKKGRGICNDCFKNRQNAIHFVREVKKRNEFLSEQCKSIDHMYNNMNLTYDSIPCILTLDDKQLEYFMRE